MAGGVGMCPHKFKRGGESPTLATPPRVGPKTQANPKPNGGGKMGGPGGRSPHGRGPWGVSPHKTLKEGASAHISNPATSGTQNPGKPKANGGGKRGSRGAKPPWRGVWGVSPHKTLKGGELPTLATPPRGGPKTPASPKPTRVGKGGGGGRSPLPGGLGDVPPQKKRGGERLH
jgi:hypothetical protein